MKIPDYYNDSPESTAILLNPLEVNPDELEAACITANSHFDYLSSDDTICGFKLINFQGTLLEASRLFN